MYGSNSCVTTVYFHDTQVSPLKSLLIEGFGHIRSYNSRLVDYSSQQPRCDAKMVGLGACPPKSWQGSTPFRLGQTGFPNSPALLTVHMTWYRMQKY